MTNSNPKFEVFKGIDNQWYFNLKAPNGEIIASSEGYKQKSGALNGIDSIKQNAPIAKILVELE